VANEPAGRAVEKSIPEISREELAKRIGDPSLTIVNVLPQEAWLESRIPSSLSLPVAEIPSRAREVLPELSQEIAVYCGGHT